MNTLLLIDGHNLLFQMFFGMPSRIVNKDGKAIQGTLGFVGALLKIIRHVQPTHVAVLFDGEHENDRSALDPNYKANRPNYAEMNDEETPFSQLPDVYAALDHLGIKHTEIIDYETDDAIASYALQYRDEMQVVIVSFDSDFFQLIHPNVSVLRYRGDNTVLCDTEYIRAKFGIMPTQYTDFKALVGDTADNIKGADKIGPKTAAQLLCDFQTLENVLQNAQCIKKPSVRESIITNTERLKQNYQLIELSNRARLPFSIQELEYFYNGMTTNEVLKAIGLK